MTGWQFFRERVPLLICFLLPIFVGCDRRVGDALPPPTRPNEVIPARATLPPSPAPAAVVAESPVPSHESTDERIRAVILQHSAAAKRISSYRTDVAWEERQFDETSLDQPLPEGIVTSSGGGTLIWQEGKWRVEHRNRMDRIDPMLGQIAQHDGLRLKAQVAPELYDTWAVYNGEYFARRSTQMGHSLYCYFREQIEYQAFLFPNPLEFGFQIAPWNGTFDATFATSQLPTHKPMTHWALDAVEEAEGGRKIRISRNVDTEQGNWQTQYLIDPERDFLVVSLDVWYPPNGKTDEYRLELQQLAGGRWFPKEAHYRNRGSYSRWVFSNVSIDVVIDPLIFNLESIPFDPDLTRLIKQDANGSDKVYLFRDGQWVPESLVPKHLRPVRK